MINKWDKRFIEMAQLVGTWSSCFKRDRQMGAIVIKDKRILTTGYNGAPTNVKSCKERDECIRVKQGIKSGERHEICYAVHAETNAIVQAAKQGISLDGATLYVTHQPCSICTRIIINAGIVRVVYIHSYPDDWSNKLFAEAKVKVEQITMNTEQ
ncbi:MAG: cytidine/deoxycytidylate deaminase family protein [Firmicutes bacterium]|nr:cytidine/deoxycytidylate deaminase family protein [Bacillota bacterium]